MGCCETEEQCTVSSLFLGNERDTTSSLLFLRDAFIIRTSKHSGPIKALQFNPHRPELLATAGAKGELYITDLNNPENPYRVGISVARADDFDTLDWNKKVPHILVTGSSGGFVTVWDVKARKESLTLNNHGRKPVSAVAWNPDVPTKLATAISTDQEPLILLWNLRNSSAPERILKGHDQGVLGLAWCLQDSDLLLSCGKDNRNLCWNPHTGECVGEYPIVLNWAFQTRWNPCHPNLLATASFDGKIAIQSIQNTNIKNEEGGTAVSQADGADFFAKAQTQPQVTSFTLTKPPKWMRRPAGVSFGFGGKIVRFQLMDEQSKKSKVQILIFTPDATVATSISEFQDALKGEDVSRMCDSRISGTGSEAGKEDWKVIQALVSGSPRKSILAYLGFNDAVAEEPNGLMNGDKDSKDEELEARLPVDSETTKANRLSAFFDSSGESPNFLTDLASSKGARTNNPFHIYKGGESAADKEITRNLMLGKFEDALDICLKEKRMSEAFMIAICGGQKCIDKAQAAYFSQQTNGPNYLRLLASVVGKNLWDIVYNADLANWKEVMATLCTYADENEFPDLCEALGDRFEESDAPKKEASFCYLAGSKLEKVVPLWLVEMQEVEKSRSQNAKDESAFTIHVQSLQSFIEKVSIFRRATQYEDRAGRDNDSDIKLGTLYDKYAEYADVAAAHGYLDLADQYLSLLPEQYASAEVARNRVKQATKKAIVAPRANPRATTPITSAVPAPSSNAARQPVNPSYMPSNTLAAPGPAAGYAPSSAGTYAPAQPFSTPYQPAGQPGRPPTSTGPPPTGPPPGKNVNGMNWNDLPDGYKLPPRRTTPSPGTPPVSTPFANPNQRPPPASYGAPPTAPHYTQPKAAPLPPPPKAGQAPPRTSSPSVDSAPHLTSPPSRPASSVANTYAPTTNLAATAPPPSNHFAPPNRSASPYHAPPSGPPPSNRYAPAPAAPGGPAAPSAAGPPPTASRPVAPNPYAPSSTYAPAPQPAPGQGASQPGPPPPPRGFSAGPPPGSGPRPPSAQAQTPATPAAPPAARHRK